MARLFIHYLDVSDDAIDGSKDWYNIHIGSGVETIIPISDNLVAFHDAKGRTMGLVRLQEGAYLKLHEEETDAGAKSLP